MKIPFSYTWRSLWTRRLTTALTLSGVALVTFVFAAVLMMAHGVEETMIQTGAPDNIIALRRSASSELVSQIGREAATILSTYPEVAAGTDGKPLATSEVVIVITLFKKESNNLGNISVRGVSPAAFTLRPQVKLSEGRMFSFGSHEIVVGSSIAKRFKDCEIGKEVNFSGDRWTIVGVIDGGKTAFDSEIWSDVEQLMPAVGRPVFSSATMRLRDVREFDRFSERLQKDPRVQYVEIKHEQAFYEEQSKAMSLFISILGTIVTVIFSIGAMIGAMITMYGAIANRTVEIGTLRSLGFRRRSILAAFLIESVLISVIGGLAGLVLAMAMTFVKISTVNFGTFSELAFAFTMSPPIVLSTMIFAVFMGFVGGFLPAVRAARLNIVNALRAS
jgi:ABC-type lipoprotein release transport system permease subunit